jgi:hypothetical protein
METIAWAKEYGWLPVLVWMLIRDVWPFIKDKLFPAALAERQQIVDHRINLEERQAAAYELIATAVNEIKLAIVSNNERLNSLSTNMASHNRETAAAITLMRERTRPENRKPVD